MSSRLGKKGNSHPYGLKRSLTLHEKLQLTTSSKKTHRQDISQDKRKPGLNLLTLPFIIDSVGPNATVMIRKDVVVESRQRGDFERDAVGTLPPQMSAISTTGFVTVLSVHQIPIWLVTAMCARSFIPIFHGESKGKKITTVCLVCF